MVLVGGSNMAQDWSRKSLTIIVIIAIIIPWIFSFVESNSSSSSSSNVKKIKNIPAVVVFGDSSVDSGNNNFIPTMARSNFEPYGCDFLAGVPTGRFCNGRIPPDLVSEAVGLKPTIPAYLDPSYKISDFAYGVCFASAGTGYDNATSDVLDVIPMWKQVEYFKEYQSKLSSYLGDEKAKRIVNDALYLVSIGTNDFLENYFSPALPQRQRQFTVPQYEDFLIGLAESFAKDIYRLGARKIAMAGLPPMGCLPLQRFTNIFGFHACAEKMNVLAVDYNDKFQRMMARLNVQLPGIKLVYSDVYEVFLDIIRRPSVYGFEESRFGCCGSGRFEMGRLCGFEGKCPDANRFVFWDAFHPTERTNRIITDHLVKNNLAKIL